MFGINKIKIMLFMKKIRVCFYIEFQVNNNIYFTKIIYLINK